MVNAKTKASLQSSAIVWDVDSCSLQGYCFFHNTSSKMKTQGTTAKNFYSKKPKIKESKQTCINVIEPPEQKNKKKKIKKHKRNNTVEQKN